MIIVIIYLNQLSTIVVVKRGISFHSIVKYSYFSTVSLVSMSGFPTKHAK